MLIRLNGADRDYSILGEDTGKPGTVEQEFQSVAKSEPP
jgi:hypothetical protein